MTSLPFARAGRPRRAAAGPAPRRLNASGTQDLPRFPAAGQSRKLLSLAADPFGRHGNVKRLTCRDAYRLRVGDWRALYTIDTERQMISVLVIRPRGGAHD